MIILCATPAAQTCTGSLCGDAKVLKPGCKWLTYPGVCNTGGPVSVALNNCFANRADLDSVSVVLPDDTCTKFSPGGDTIGTLKLTCGDAVTIFGHGGALSGNVNKAPDSCTPPKDSCKTCRYTARVRAARMVTCLI